MIAHINNLVNTYPKHVIVVLGDYNADMARGTNRYAKMLRPAITRLSFRHASPTKKGQYTWRRSQNHDSERTLIDFVMIRAPRYHGERHDRRLAKMDRGKLSFPAY